jgi:hypothetical protein
MTVGIFVLSRLFYSTIIIDRTYLAHPFKKMAPWAFIARLFLVIRWDSAIERAGGMVLMDQRKQAGMGSRSSGKAYNDFRRGLLKTASDTTLPAGWTSSTGLTLAHLVLLQAIL